MSAARGRSRGVLTLLAVLLVASGVMRVGFGGGLAPVRSAMASSIEASGRALAAAPDVLADVVPEPAALRLSRDDAEGIERLIAALAEREETLDAREAAMDAREADAEASAAARMAEIVEARAELQGMLGELEAAEARLDAAIARASGAAEDDLARLTSVYESMAPKDAGALFETMEPGFAAGFLGRMRPEAAAEVMAVMTPERAYAVSAIIAGRNARIDAPGAASRVDETPPSGSPDAAP